MTEIEAYIRQAALARGIDPDTAVRVARSEGGLDNPVRQSDVVKNGQREQSYGPFQLLMKGGLGEQALNAGIDPRDPNQWKQSVDFALNHAARHGWGSWYGAANVGVGDFQGIGKNASPAGITLTSTRMPGQTGNPATAPVIAGTDTPTPAPTTAEPTFLEKLLGNKDVLGSMAKAASPDDGGDALNRIDPVTFSPTTGGSGDNPAAAALLSQLIADRKKRHGLSLNGMG